MNRLPPRDLNGLLKFCIESTRSEDASGNIQPSVRPEDISPERREFLRQALEQCSSDWESENLVGCIKCLTEEESVMNEGSDVERQEEALDIIEDWTDNIDMANNFYVLGGYQALRLCLKSPHNSLVAGSMNAIGVIAQNNPLSQERLFQEGFLQMVLDKLSEERHDIPVNKKGILAVSAMTRAYRPALNSMDKNKLQTVTNVLFNDATVDPAWTQVRAKTAFYLACVMEEDADLAERESNRVQRNLTELCIGPDLLNLAFHQDEASEYVARCLAALFGKPHNPEVIRQCRESCDHLLERLNEKIATLKKMNEGENEGALDDEIQHLENILQIIVDRETVDSDHEPTEADRNSVDR